MLVSKLTHDELMNEYKKLFCLAGKLLLADPYSPTPAYARAGEALESYMNDVEKPAHEESYLAYLG